MESVIRENNKQFLALYEDKILLLGFYNDVEFQDVTLVFDRKILQAQDL
jgi:hypothetical protein